MKHVNVRLVAAVAAAAVGVSALAACGSPASSPSPGASGSPQGAIKIGFSQMDLTNAHFVKLAAGWTKFAQEKGIEDIDLSSDDSPDKQASMVETWANSGFDAIAICALDGAAVHNAAQLAKSKGIPILNVYNMQEGDFDAATWNPDVVQGETLAKAVADYITTTEPWKSYDKIEFATINNDTVASAIPRTDAMEEYLKAHVPNIEFVDTALGGQSTENALAMTESLLQKHPNLQIVLAVSDTAALGVYQAFKNAGKTDPDKYLVGGIDAIPEVLKLIKQGTIYQISVDPDAVNAGYQMAKMTYELAEGKDVEDWTFQLKPVSKANVQEVIDANVKLGVMTDD